MIEVNAPEALAGLTAAFDAYERALITNDLDAMRSLFWDSPLAIRFGPAENLYGIDAITAFRTARAGGSPPRVLSNTVLTTFGLDFGTANTEFLRQGAPASGRQSQSWVRLDGVWRIVAAHISIIARA